MRDGAELWERELRGGNIQKLAMTDHVVMAVGHDQRRVRLFDRSSGALIARILFDQPTGDTTPIDLVTVGSLIVGPDHGADGEDPGIVAYDMQTGKRAWRAGFVKPVVHVFPPGLTYVGVGLLGGDVAVLEAGTGEIAFTHRVEGANEVRNGRVIDTSLVVQSFGPNERSMVPELVSLDIATGNTVWRRADLARPAAFEKMTASGTLPAIIQLRNSRSRSQTVLGAAVIDLRTGETVGDAANLATQTSSVHRFNGDFGLYDGVMLVGFSDSVQAYTTEPVDPANKEDL